MCDIACLGKCWTKLDRRDASLEVEFLNCVPHPGPGLSIVVLVGARGPQYRPPAKLVGTMAYSFVGIDSRPYTAKRVPSVAAPPALNHSMAPPSLTAVSVILGVLVSDFVRLSSKTQTIFFGNGS